MKRFASLLVLLLSAACTSDDNPDATLIQLPDAPIPIDSRPVSIDGGGSDAAPVTIDGGGVDAAPVTVDASVQPDA